MPLSLQFVTAAMLEVYSEHIYSPCRATPQTENRQYTVTHDNKKNIKNTCQQKTLSLNAVHIHCGLHQIYDKTQI